MQNLLLGFSLTASFSLAGAAGVPSEREGIEWCDIWISHANETNLPRVLRIGGSIRQDRTIRNRH